MVFCQSFDSVYGLYIWPEPQQKIIKKDVYVIDSNNFDFFLGPDSSTGCDVVERAFKRYRDTIFRRGCPGWKASWRKQQPLRRHHRSNLVDDGLFQLQNLTVYYRTCDPYPHNYMDEMYTLSVGSIARSLDIDKDSNEASSYSSGPGTLVANTAWGVLRGLETFSQLVYRPSSASNDFYVNGSLYSGLSPLHVSGHTAGHGPPLHPSLCPEAESGSHGVQQDERVPLAHCR